MQRADITPDGAGAPRPMHASNAIMIARDQAQHIITNKLVLEGVHAVDATNMQPDAGEQRFPARDGVRADHRVRGLELVADVQRRPARRHDVVAAGLARGLEDRLCARRRQRLEELLERRRNSVV